MILLFTATLVWNGCSRRTEKLIRVGILSGLDYFADTIEGFKGRMTELGYEEGRNIVYEVRRTNFDEPTERKILKGFVDEKVDLILVFPTEPSLEAKAAVAGTKVPVVFVHANIEGVDLVKSVREPGGNVTGVRFPGPDLALRRFEIMNDLAPNAKRYWIPYQRGYPIVQSQLEVVRKAADERGISVIEAPADGAAELARLLAPKASAADPGMDAILFIAEPLGVMSDVVEVVGKFAAERKLPIGGCMMDVNGYGDMFGVAVDNAAGGRQAAVIADMVLKGTPAGTIPVVSDESVLEINCKIAAKVGVPIPASLIYQAAKVIR